MFEQAFRDALAIVATPETWTTLAMARDAAGKVVKFDDPSAVAWCPLAALQIAAAAHNIRNEPDGGPQRLKMFTAAFVAVIDPPPLPRAWGIHPIVAWNDQVGRTHGDVLAAFARAIAANRGR